MRRTAKTKSAAEIVAEILADQEGRASGRREAMVVRVFRAFSRLGPPITAHAEPVQFRAGVLYLSVDDSGWLTELTFLAPEIKERLNKLLKRDVVREIRLRHAPLARIATKTRGPVAAVKLAPEDEAVIEKWAEPIKNEEIRSAMKKAARRAVADAGRKRGG